MFIFVDDDGIASSRLKGMVSVPYCCFNAGLMKRQPMVVSSSICVRSNPLWALPITNGARDIDSTPPARIRSASPAAIERYARPMASIPEPHKRLIVVAGTENGTPASKVAILATFRLSSPAWLAQPKNASSMLSAGS